MVDIFRYLIGPIQYFRYLIEDNPNRENTVGFIRFYDERNNTRCIEELHGRLEWTKGHCVQLIPNFVRQKIFYDYYPDTLVMISERNRQGRFIEIDRDIYLYRRA